jgi:glutamate N-acetyltransferase / amino-acid N-acetyltransferase
MDMELPSGFRYAGVSAGIKKKPNTKDITLIVGEGPVVAAGVYTTNQVVAAPVVLDRQRTPAATLRVVVVNSGCANACTGSRGMEDAIRMTELVGQYVACGEVVDPSQVLVMSTGVIGRFLPMEKIESGIREAAAQLRSGPDGFLDASDGIMTTDAFRKVIDRRVVLGDKTIRIAGMAKGAGMIGPNMATMLACIMTDAKLEPERAQRLLRRAVERSFNCISVEGHTSTNDTLLLLASGAACASPLNASEEARFAQELEDACIALAIQIPDDGEGATHLIEIDIQGAASDASAHKIAATVAASNLVKTAIAGADPNWGRIVSAAGYAGEPIETRVLQLIVNGHLLFDRGEPTKFDEQEVSLAIRSQRKTQVRLQVGYGPGVCRYWTSDLNEAYVHFNSDYTT